MIFEIKHFKQVKKIIGIAFVLFIFSFSILFSLNNSTDNFLSTEDTSSLNSLRTEFQKCFRNTSTGKVINCMSEYVPTWIQTFGSSQVAEELLFYEKESGEDLTCHLAGHVIGEHIFNDEIDTLRMALNHCTSACHNGCIHGAVGAFVTKYGEEELFLLKPKELCEDISTNTGGYLICIHGLGHSFMLGSNYETSRSLQACDNLELSYLTKDKCYSGVFMELFGATSGHVPVPEEKYKREGDLFYPCTDGAISSNYGYARACYMQIPQLLWAYSYKEELSIFEVCEQADPQWTPICAMGTGLVQAALNTSNVDSIILFCRSARDSHLRDRCLYRAFEYLIIEEGRETKEANIFCDKLNQDEIFVCDPTFTKFLWQ